MTSSNESNRSGALRGRMGLAIVGIAVVLTVYSFAPARGPATPPPRRCVGVFVSGERRSVAADSRSLVVVGQVPCAERGVVSWAMQGVYRAFDDGSVEFLATPTPPCPEGDAYVWIRYPNPGT